MRTRFSRSLLCALVLSSSLSFTLVCVGGTPADAAVAKGQAAAKKKDWVSALSSYEEANKLAEGKDPKALEGLAGAEFEMGRYGEAHEHYDALFALLPGPASNAKRATYAARLKTLLAKTGTLELTVSAPGAKVLVSDRVVGVAPLKPFRVTAGPLKVRVEKEGFSPWERSPNIPVGETTKLSVNLEEEKLSTRVTVKEQTGKKVRVFLDGTDVGETPWTGPVAPGVHELVLRGAGLLSEAQKVELTPVKAQGVSNCVTPLKLVLDQRESIIECKDAS